MAWAWDWMGMGWDGTGWYGMAWDGIGLDGMAWYGDGMVRYGMGMVWYGDRDGVHQCHNDFMVQVMAGVNIDGRVLDDGNALALVVLCVTETKESASHKEQLEIPDPKEPAL